MLQNARSSSLKKKLLKLLAPGKHKIQDKNTLGDAVETEQKPPNTNQESELIAKAINAILWKKMQKELYDPLAARQLKYFKFGGEEVIKDVMLEEEHDCQPYKSALIEEDTSFMPLEEVEVLSFDELESYDLRDQPAEKVENNDVKYLDELDSTSFSALEDQDVNYDLFM